MATKNDFPTKLCARLCRSFAFGLAAVALYSQAHAPAQAREIKRTIRPHTFMPPVVLPPRTGVEGARGYRAPLAEERARWAKLSSDLSIYTPILNKTTNKYGFKSTGETFNHLATATSAWLTMIDISEALADGDVKRAKNIWKQKQEFAENFWHGRTDGRLNSDVRYGTDKAGKAKAKADEAAHRNVTDNMWHQIKNAEAKGLKP